MWIIAVWIAVAVGILVRWKRSGTEFIPSMGLGAIGLYARVWHGMRRTGQLSRDQAGPAIIIANHTSSADAGLLSACCNRPLSFLMGAEYYKIPLLNRLLRYMQCVPVSRNGRDAAAVRQALKLLENQHVVCLFPEGGLSGAGRSRGRRGKCGAAYLALKTRAPVIPVLISGGPRTCDLARAWLWPSRVQVTIGDAVNLDTYYGKPVDRKLLDEVTRLLMARIAALENGSLIPSPTEGKP